MLFVWFSTMYKPTIGCMAYVINEHARIVFQKTMTKINTNLNYEFRTTTKIVVMMRRKSFLL